LGPVETEFSRRLRERIEEGRRRLAGPRERGEWPGSVGNDEGENLGGNVTEILQHGRGKIVQTSMPLSAGTRLGPYEILAAIGAGGIGEVYRARDTKLERSIALPRPSPSYLFAKRKE
jgi:hypothetical protein